MKKIQTVFILIIISLAGLQTTRHVFALSVVPTPRCFVEGIIQYDPKYMALHDASGLKDNIQEVNFVVEILINKSTYVDGDNRVLSCDSMHPKGDRQLFNLLNPKMKINLIPVAQQKISGIVGSRVFDSYSLSGTGLVSLGGISERIKAFFLTIKQFLKF